MSDEVKALTLADEYEAGLQKMIASGYEEFGPDVQANHRLVIKGLRLLAAQSAAPAGEPVAWQACDTRYAVINGIVTVQKSTVDAWRESGINFTALYAASPTSEEPVAWRWRDRPDLPWTYQEYAPSAHPEMQMLYAAPAPIAPQVFPFLAALLTTLNVMKTAHSRGGDRRMSIWTHDIQAVEAAVEALSQPRPGEQKPPSQTYATFGSDRVSMRSEKV